MKRDDLLDLNDVLQHPGRTLSVDIDTELESQTDVDLLNHVEGYLEAVSTGNLLLITGEFKTTANLECARCASPLAVDVTFAIDEQVPVEGVPSSYGTQDTARLAPDEPFELFEGNFLIVEALLRESLVVALPIQPLCEHGWDQPCPVATKLGIAQGAVASSPLAARLAELLHEPLGDDKA
ncbi:MAG: YceD family protein [Fimbriimonadaceae bacterium]